MEEKTFLTVDEVAEILTVSRSKAYEIVRQLNKELKEKGIITVVARVGKAYFYERMCYSKEQRKELIIRNTIDKLIPAVKSFDQLV